MKNLKFYFVALTILTVLNSSAIVLVGDITGGGATPSLAPNTYQVLAGTNIYIPAGVTFAIEPGVIIEFEPNSQFYTEAGSNLIIMENTDFQFMQNSYVRILGDLFVNGTSTGPATFREHPANVGASWKGIIFDGCVTDTVLIDFAKITDVENFGGTYLPYKAGAICVYNSTFDVFHVRNSTFKKNKVELFGGAICFKLSSVTNSVLIENNLFRNNRTRRKGGAIYIDSKLTTEFMIFHNRFIKNKATNGGAIFLEDAIGGGLEVAENSFDRNTANFNGGACYLTGDVININFTRNKFTKNTAVNRDGGAIFFTYFYHANNMHMLHNVFCLNEARDGGAICSINEKGDEKKYLNNLFNHNSASDQGGAIYCESDYNFLNNTFADNTAVISTGGIYATTATAGSYGIINNILWGNTPLQVNSVLSVGNTYPAFDYNCIDYTGAAAGTNINSDPLFVNPAVHDYHLQIGSPCFDTGQPGFNPSMYFASWAEDLDYSARIKSAEVDMGAYESWTTKSAKVEVPALVTEVVVYPNPAINTVNIALENAESISSILVTNLFGQLIMKVSGNEINDGSKTKSIDVSEVENGVYFVVIKRVGGKSNTEKLIIN